MYEIRDVLICTQYNRPVDVMPTSIDSSFSSATKSDWIRFALFPSNLQTCQNKQGCISRELIDM